MPVVGFDHAALGMLKAVRHGLTALGPEQSYTRAGAALTAPVHDVDQAVLSMLLAVRRNR